MTTPLYEWKDTVVLITGGATGIGAHAARKIVEEGAKHVALLDIAETAGKEFENELNSKHGVNKAKFYKCDVTNEEVFLATFEAVKDEQGYIDVVINNAGIMRDKVYKKEIELNVTALVTGTLKAIEIMRKDKGGRGGTVINISSILGLMQSPLMPIYNATKSAVLQFSNCIGMNEYYSKTGVRVLAICFGGTYSNLLNPNDLGIFDPAFEPAIQEVIKNFKYQDVESAAQALVDAFKIGESGSTWLSVYDRPVEEVTANVQKGYEIMSKGI